MYDTPKTQHGFVKQVLSEAFGMEFDRSSRGTKNCLRNRYNNEEKCFDIVWFHDLYKKHKIYWANLDTEPYQFVEDDYEL